MKKFILVSFLIIFISMTTTITTIAKVTSEESVAVKLSNNVVIDLSDITIQQEFGTVRMNFKSYNSKYFKTIIEKDGINYIYNNTSEIETLPLQMGSGVYTINILGSDNGKGYKSLSKKNITVEMKKNAVFLNTSQIVYWNDESEITVLTNDLIKNARSDREKFELIHNYIIYNVAYDYQKANSLPRGYLSNPDSTLKDGLGICYDFAALTASMLRSVGIPTKLVQGYSSNTPAYHAWNEVLIDNEWIIVDASTDSILAKSTIDINIEKDITEYSPSKYY